MSLSLSLSHLFFPLSQKRETQSNQNKNEKTKHKKNLGFQIPHFTIIFPFLSLSISLIFLFSFLLVFPPSSFFPRPVISKSSRGNSFQIFSFSWPVDSPIFFFFFFFFVFVFGFLYFLWRGNRGKENKTKEIPLRNSQLEGILSEIRFDLKVILLTLRD